MPKIAPQRILDGRDGVLLRVLTQVSAPLSCKDILKHNATSSAPSLSALDLKPRRSSLLLRK
jgi:hypothetical protein